MNKQQQNSNKETTSNERQRNRHPITKMHDYLSIIGYIIYLEKQDRKKKA